MLTWMNIITKYLILLALANNIDKESYVMAKINSVMNTFYFLNQLDKIDHEKV